MSHLKAIFCLLAIFCIANPVWSKELSFLVHPYIEKSNILQKFEPIKKQLEEELGQQIKIHVPKSYNAHSQIIKEGSFDFAFIGPFALAQISNDVEDPQLIGTISRKKGPFFKGAIICRETINGLTSESMKTKDLAMVSPLSTMGKIVPLNYLKSKFNIDIKDFNSFKYLGSHDNVALSVLSGKFDIGLVKENIFYKYKDRGLELISFTYPVYEHVFLTSKKLDENIKKQLKKVFYSKQAKESLIKINKDSRGLEGVSILRYRELKNKLNL